LSHLQQSVHPIGSFCEQIRFIHFLFLTQSAVLFVV
jgi:hypothetical protein